MSAPDTYTLIEHVAAFFGSDPSLEAIAAFVFPPELEARLQFLLDQNEQGGISAEEAAEADDIFQWAGLVTTMQHEARLRLGK